MKLLILSDIHGNLSALNSVLEDAKKYNPDAVALLGDYIDYGMRSNETAERLKALEIPTVCRLWGNHEDAIMNDRYDKFSSLRGVKSAQFTKSRLSAQTVDFLLSMENKSGKAEFEFGGKRFLAVHGSLEDNYWKSILPYSDLSGYEKYDYVLSGHSHYSHMFPMFYKCDNHKMRDKKRTLFINPGSVGQPRNHNPKAQYALLNLESGVYMNSVDYDIAYEMGLYTGELDDFYKMRLEKGI